MTLQKSCLLPELSLPIKAQWGKAQQRVEPLGGGNAVPCQPHAGPLCPLCQGSWEQSCCELSGCPATGALCCSGPFCSELTSPPYTPRQVTAPPVPSNANTAPGLNKAMARMGGFLHYLLQLVLNQNIMQLSKTKTRSLLSKVFPRTVQNIRC